MHTCKDLMWRKILKNFQLFMPSKQGLIIKLITHKANLRDKCIKSN
jgi:hypothetical protein